MHDLSQGCLHFKSGGNENFANSQVKIINDRTSSIFREVGISGPTESFALKKKKNLKDVLFPKLVSCFCWDFRYEEWGVLCLENSRTPLGLGFNPP